MDNLKKRINAVLKECNFNSEKELSRKAKIHQSTLSGLLYKGKGLIGTRNKVQKAIKPISLDWLLMGDEPKYLSERINISREEIRRIARKEAREEIAIKDLQFESTELSLNIPPPPDEFTGEDLQRYDRNAGLLLRWARTDKAQKTFPNGVEEYALERFCIEAEGYYGGGWIDDVSGLLKDFIEEGK